MRQDAKTRKYNTVQQQLLSIILKRPERGATFAMSNPITITKYSFGNSYDNKQCCLTIPNRNRIMNTKLQTPFVTMSVATYNYQSVDITRPEALTILKTMRSDSNTTNK